jgi:hypothetical protein
MIWQGHNYLTALDELHQIYGCGTSVTDIKNRMRWQIGPKGGCTYLVLLVFSHAATVVVNVLYLMFSFILFCT